LKHSNSFFFFFHSFISFIVRNVEFIIYLPIVNFEGFHVALLELHVIKLFEQVPLLFLQFAVETFDVPFAVGEVVLELCPRNAMDSCGVAQSVKLLGFVVAVGLLLVRFVL